jgi:hypothetical protein
MYGSYIWVFPPDKRKKGVFQKTSGRDRWKAARFCNGKQVFIFVENRISERHIGLVPRRTAPRKPLAGPQDIVCGAVSAVYENLARVDAIQPAGLSGMAIFTRQVDQNGKSATSIIYLLPVFKSVI